MLYQHKRETSVIIPLGGYRKVSYGCRVNSTANIRGWVFGATPLNSGLEKLRQELQAENEGVVLPLAINWIGGLKDVQKKKAEEKKASSVVFAVKGSKMAEKVLKGGLRVAGVKYDVEKFVNAGPDSFCGVCSRWGHVEAKCGSLTMPACMLCTGRHLTKDHKCNMVGCKANAGQNCTHNVDKCVNCKGNRNAKANCCVKKQAAIKTAREERRTWKERGNVEM